MPNDLYEHISILAKKYNLSNTKMIVKLLEIGYLKFSDIGGKVYEVNNK